MIILIGACFISNVYSQVNVFTRAGLSTLNEIQLEVVSPLEKGDTSRFIYTNVGYAFRSFNLNRFGCGTFWPAPLFTNGNKGFSFKIGIIHRNRKVKKEKTIIRNHTIAIFYRRLKGTIRENESGCSQNWRNFTFTSNGYGFSYYKDRTFNKVVTWYWGVSFLRRLINRNRIPEGMIAPYSEKKEQRRLLLDMGFRIRLASIKGKGR